MRPAALLILSAAVTLASCMSTVPSSDWRNNQHSGRSQPPNCGRSLHKAPTVSRAPATQPNARQNVRSTVFVHSGYAGNL